jgi:hypothetical protein
MLCQMGSKRVHQQGLLLHQRLTCPELHGMGRLLWRLDWYTVRIAASTIVSASFASFF